MSKTILLLPLLMIVMPGVFANCRTCRCRLWDHNNFQKKGGKHADEITDELCSSKRGGFFGFFALVTCDEAIASCGSICREKLQERIELGNPSQFPYAFPICKKGSSALYWTGQADCDPDPTDNVHNSFLDKVGHGHLSLDDVDFAGELQNTLCCGQETNWFEINSGQWDRRYKSHGSLNCLHEPKPTKKPKIDWPSCWNSNGKKK